MRFYFVFILLLASFLPVRAQQTNSPLSGRASLERLAESYRINSERLSGALLRLAEEKSWPVFQTLPGGGVAKLQRTDGLGLPVYKITTSNIRSAATTGTDLLWPGASSGTALSGSAETLASRLAIWDGGAVLPTHQEFGNRIIKKDDPLPANEHATHVAGTLIAAGVNRPAKGMAFGAPNLIAYDFLNDNAEMAEEAAMLLVSNHSYGALAGWWHNQGQDRWEWYGQSGQTEDYKFGYYDVTAWQWDQIAWNAPYYLIVKSAGNNRNINGPEKGSPYYRFNKDGILAPAPAGAPFPSPNNGYDLLPLYATAKNILLVGAVNPVPGGYGQPEDVVMSPFSSWGPTDDGRIKPDIMGNGVGVLSASSDADDAYTVLSGTSMAAPNIAGSLMLLQELYSRGHQGAFMRSATLRGLVIHTASEAGPAPGPDYRFGWGLLNAKKAADLILNDSSSALILEKELDQDERTSYEVIASGYQPLEVSICWTDPESDTLSEAHALNNPAPRLVNDLDIRISASSGDSTIFYPWILDPARPESTARTGDNRLDNVEKMMIREPIHGGRYTIQVSHKNTLQRGPQAYSLIVSGAGGITYCSSRPLDSTGISIAGFQAGTLNYTAAGKCGAYTNLLNQHIQVGAGNAVPFSLQTDRCGGGGDGEHIIKLFADWNGDGDFNGQGELLAVSPVLGGAATFSDHISVPGSLPAGTIIRLRVVAAETSLPGQVLPCGSYPGGETLDTSIEIVRPRQDLAIEALTVPGADGFCPGERKLVRVLLRNRGTQAVGDFPLSAEISENANIIASLEGRFKGSLAPGDTAVYTFPYYFTAAPETAYTFALGAGAEGDQFNQNNRLTAKRTSGPAPEAPTGMQALICDSGQNAVLITGPADVTKPAATLYWYDQPRGGNLLGAGDTVTAAFTGNQPIFFAAANEFHGQIGPETKSGQASASGVYDQHAPAVIINTDVPLVIESARLYTGNAGKIAVTVYDSHGTEIARSLQHVGASRRQPAAGSLPDDPLDTGETYYLNLQIPKPGQYRLTVGYQGTRATIFRNAGNMPYPLRIPGIMTITGNTTAEEAAGNYHYFYNMKVKAAGCPSPRVAVEGMRIPPPRITRSGDTLFSEGRPPRQWYLNGAPLEGATKDRFHATVSGTYQVSTKLGKCTIFSEPFSFLTLDELIASLEHNGLKIYPNPTRWDAQTPLSVEFYAKEQDQAELTVTDMLGKLIYREQPTLRSGKNNIQLIEGKFPPGMYVLTLHLNEDRFSEKFIVH